MVYWRHMWPGMVCQLTTSAVQAKARNNAVTLSGQSPARSASFRLQVLSTGEDPGLGRLWKLDRGPFDV